MKTKQVKAITAQQPDVPATLRPFQQDDLEVWRKLTAAIGAARPMVAIGYVTIHAGAALSLESRVSTRESRVSSQTIT